MKKKLLFVINTLSRAGAENALLGFLRKLDSHKYEVFLYVLTGQGEMIGELPDHVRLLNPVFSEQSVLTGRGRLVLMKTVLKSFVRNGRFVYKIFYTARNFAGMLRKKRIQTDKLFWRVISDGAERFDMSFDLAAAWIEGGSVYYVADHVKAQKKIAFIHIDYESAGYTRALDQDCFIRYADIFAVSEETKAHFLEVYPEHAAKLAVLHNMLDQRFIRLKAQEKGGFEDGYQGFRILSVGRLTWQKGYDIAIEAMGILKKRGYDIKWYVLGEGDQKKALKEKIQEMELEEDFLLLGHIENPYPYYVQTDLYVHAARYEGKSIAIQEAQTLGCAVIASDSNGNREQIEDGKDGILCKLTSRAVAECIEMLYMNEGKRKELGEEAKRKEISHEQEQLFQRLVV